MSDTTKIQWATATFNPWIGCTKVSPGCKNCYAENTTRARVLRSQGHETWGKGAKRSRTSEATWRNPIKWNRDSELWHTTPRPRIFPSLCDWLDDEVPIEWLSDFLKLIRDTPNLDWLLLTKRPENWRSRIEQAITLWQDAPEHAEEMEEFLDGWLDCIDMPERGDIPQNVWIGTSCEDQQRADERIPELLYIPAKVRFLSLEPLLGPVEFSNVTGRSDVVQQLGKPALSGIDWVIVGGESGSGARQCSVDWVRSVVKQCAAVSVPVFVKQLGGNLGEFDLIEQARLSGKSMHHPKGGDTSEWDPSLRILQFPTP